LVMRARRRVAWAALGLTHYEVPIDSRLAKWLKTFGFPMDVSAAGLADPGCYAVVSDGFRALCEAADVPPCVMDAAILVSFDCEWSEDETIF